MTEVEVLVEVVAVAEVAEVVVEEVRETSPTEEDTRTEVQVVEASLRAITTKASASKTRMLGQALATRTMIGTKQQELVVNGSEETSDCLYHS